MVDYLANNPCADCGETNVILLDFDHDDPDNKKHCVARLANRRRDILVDEIAKCTVRCTACHRFKTAKEQGWYKGVILPPGTWPEEKGTI